MADYPYIHVASAVLAGNGTGTIQTAIAQNEQFAIDEIFFTSTGAFSVTGIRDSAAVQFTNASSVLTIPSTIMLDVAGEFTNILKFKEPLVIEKGRQLNVDLVDTSGSSNTVKLFFRGRKFT